MSNVLEVNDRSEFQDLLDTEETVVVKFWATWCGPCKQFAPSFEGAAERIEGATFVASDVDEADYAVVDYGVRGIPAVKLFRNGEFVADLTERKPIPFINEVNSYL